MVIIKKKSVNKPITADQWEHGDWNAVFFNFTEIYDAVMQHYSNCGGIIEKAGSPNEGSVDYTFEDGTKICMEEINNGFWQFY